MKTHAEIIEELKPGERYIAHGLSDKIYHESPGIGSGAMKAATKSMAHYKAYCDQEIKFSSAALKNMRVGTACHCLVLEPELFDEKIVIQPESIKQRRGDEWDKFKEKSKGREIVTASELGTADEMANEINDNPNISKYFSKGESEVSIWYRHPSGLLLKARIDYLRGDLGIDLKTTGEKTEGKFKNKCKYDYDIQDALYRMVSGVNDFIFVAVTRDRPHQPFSVRQGALVRELSELRIQKAITELVTAKEFDEYPPPPVELTETELTERELKVLEELRA